MEKQCVACSGFPTCSNAGHRVLSPGGNLGMWSEPSWVCAGQAAFPEHASGWATHRDLLWESSLQTTKVLLSFTAALQLPLPFCTKKVNQWLILAWNEGYEMLSSAVRCSVMPALSHSIMDLTATWYIPKQRRKLILA